MLTIFFPINCKISFPMLKSFSDSFPTIKVKVPAAAAVTPPLTGASRYLQFLFAAITKSLTCLATFGSIVEESRK